MQYTRIRHIVMLASIVVQTCACEREPPAATSSVSDHAPIRHVLQSPASVDATVSGAQAPECDESKKSVVTVIHLIDKAEVAVVLIEADNILARWALRHYPPHALDANASRVPLRSGSMELAEFDSVMSQFRSLANSNAESKPQIEDVVITLVRVTTEHNGASMSCDPPIVLFFGSDDECRKAVSNYPLITNFCERLFGGLSKRYWYRRLAPGNFVQEEVVELLPAK